MSDYTSRARRFTLRFPLMTHLSIQINFWIIAHIVFNLISYLIFRSFSTAFSLNIKATLGPNILLAIVLGIFYGLSFGLIEYFLENQFFRRKSLGRVLFLKAIFSLLVFFVLFGLIKLAIYKYIISPMFYPNGLSLTDQVWKYIFFMYLIYTFFINLIISFINQMNKKFGPGVLLPMLFGRYRSPKEEDRIFMFMDLKSSTSIAEVLGHIRYSAFIRDSFMDINYVLSQFNAEIYQYVGDEIVLSWSTDDGLKESVCIAFFFACEAQFNQKAEIYMREYGMVPEFKAGIHRGKVTAVEIGEIKRDIAYHGDTLNTTARIQSVCNEFGKPFLASKEMIDNTDISKHYHITSIGMISLKGKRNPVEIVSVEQI